MNCRILILIVGMMIINGCNYFTSHKTMVFPENLELKCYGCTVPVPDSLKKGKELKMVTYFEGGIFFGVPIDWEKIKLQFPEVEFLFYVSERDTSVLFKNAKSYKFNQPFYYDPERKFFKGNKINELGINNTRIITFLVDGNDIVEIPRKVPIPSGIEGMLSGFIEDSR